MTMVPGTRLAFGWCGVARLCSWTTAALFATRPVIIRKTFSLGMAEIFHLGHVSARVLMKGVR